MNLKSKYLIKKNANNTLLISKSDSNKIYKFDGVGKIILDNIDIPRDEVIKMLNQQYGVEIETLENDYDDFLQELNTLEELDLSVEKVTGTDLNNLLESKEITSCMVEITNRCQFRCDHCYVDKSQKKI